MRYLAVLGLLLAAPPPLQIKLSTHTLMRGQSLDITCRVTPDDRNRLLEAGVADYTSSRRDLDGSRAAVTYLFNFTHIPCDSGPAYCAVARNDGTVTRVATEFAVADCETP
jgi:hypothetical protein